MSDHDYAQTHAPAALDSRRKTAYLQLRRSILITLFAFKSTKMRSTPRILCQSKTHQELVSVIEIWL